MAHRSNRLTQKVPAIPQKNEATITSATIGPSRKASPVPRYTSKWPPRLPATESIIPISGTFERRPSEEEPQQTPTFPPILWPILTYTSAFCVTLFGVILTVLAIRTTASSGLLEAYNLNEHSPLIISFGVGCTLGGVILAFFYNRKWSFGDTSLVLVLTITLLIAGTLIFALTVNQERLSQDAFKYNFKRDLSNFLLSNTSAQRLQQLQATLECCGYYGPGDYTLIANRTRHFPASCCGLKLTTFVNSMPMAVCEIDHLQYTDGCYSLEFGHRTNTLQALMLVLLLALAVGIVAQHCTATQHLYAPSVRSNLELDARPPGAAAIEI